MPTKISVGESFIVALISGIEKVWRREGEVSRFSVNNFLSHSAENFRRRILYCCISFGYRRSLGKRGGGEGDYQDFLSKIFCLTVPKISVGDSFTVALISGSEKDWIGGWEYQDFPLKVFCLTVPKISVGESFTVALISVSEKFWIGGGGGSIKIFRRIFFVSQCLKFP